LPPRTDRTHSLNWINRDTSGVPPILDATRRYLLDTPLLVAYLLNRPLAVRLMSPWIEHREAATSMVVYGEVNRYIQDRPNYRQLHAQLLELLEAIPPLPVTYSIMKKYGEVIDSLRRSNHGVGEFDAILASTALDKKLTLVTDNEAFQRVPDLLIMFFPRRYLVQ
jgi:tRNA(fMet)-specific endonuclease VapC